MANEHIFNTFRLLGLICTERTHLICNVLSDIYISDVFVYKHSRIIFRKYHNKIGMQQCQTEVCTLAYIYTFECALLIL